MIKGSYSISAQCRFVAFIFTAAFFCISCPNERGSKVRRETPADRGVSRLEKLEKNVFSETAKTPGSKAVTIGFSAATDTFIIERWNKDIKVFSGAAQALGAQVIVQLSAGGTKEQIAQINYMVNQKIDILVVLANDTEVLAGAIKQIRDAGIPVIAYDRMIMGVPLDAYISFDNREVGRQLGKALTQAVPRGRYLLVNGSVNDSNSYEINAGVHEILDSGIAAGTIQIEQEIWLDEWSFDEALEKVGAIFEETVGIDAVSCGNDQIAGAVIKLLSERRLAGEVAVVGQDAELISCQYIIEGLQFMTVYKPIGKLAARAAELAMAIVQKQTHPPDALLDNRSGILIPSYIEEPIAVYKENMDVVIRDGFHTYEDVYRNWELSASQN
ncbi:MAG: substrate-binding domain-containing protein [Spirochaetaceae bacterium]|jgi:D-xylose transport system substrate-binding protein|nr:substrate-binding domain-containing protein [Spirochaetaceae bacterium]